jgi:hypothetical protein
VPWVLAVACCLVIWPSWSYSILVPILCDLWHVVIEILLDWKTDGNADGYGFNYLKNTGEASMF